MEKCSKCGKELNDDNWLKCHRRKSEKICKTCFSIGELVIQKET